LNNSIVQDALTEVTWAIGDLPAKLGLNHIEATVLYLSATVVSVFIFLALVLLKDGKVSAHLLSDNDEIPTEYTEALDASEFRGTTSLQALCCLVFFMLLFRHILVLREIDHLLFDWTIIIALTLVGWIAAITSTRSIIIPFNVALLIFLAALLRFGNHEAEWYFSVSSWFTEYFPYKVSPVKLSTGVLVFFVSGVVSLHFLRVFNGRRKKAVLKDGNHGIDPVAIEKLAVIASTLVGLILAMMATGVSIPTITIVTGLLAAGAGFAAKDVLSNIAAGVVLLWDGSFKVDDVISIDGGGYGWIDKLTLRHAVIKDRNDVSILIPYTKLIGSTIQNWTHNSDTVRLKIDIGVDYSTKDLGLAKDALTRAARLSNGRVLTDPAPRVTVIAAGSSAIQLQVRFWISDPKEGIRNVMSDVLEGMIRELKLANISIPFDTLDVNLKSFPSASESE
jgi:small-conductance mechanosensitive channel